VLDCNFIEKKSCNLFWKVYEFIFKSIWHILTPQIMTLKSLKSRPSKSSSSSPCPNLWKRRKEVDQNKTCTRTLSRSSTCRKEVRQAPEHLRLLIFLTYVIILCTASECLGLGVAWSTYLMHVSDPELRDCAYGIDNSRIRDGAYPIPYICCKVLGYEYD
jgi:hypothetical protein